MRSAGSPLRRAAARTLATLLLSAAPVLAQGLAPGCGGACDAMALAFDGGSAQPALAVPGGATIAPPEPWIDLLEPVSRVRRPVGNYMDLSLLGDTLAAARIHPNGGGVDVFDVSDPASPVKTAEIRIPYPVWDVFLFEQEGTLYVALGNETVYIPEVGAQIWALLPEGPVYVSHPVHLGAPENVHHVFVQSKGAKRFLYAGASASAFAAMDGHVDIYDVSDPANPAYLTTLGAFPPPVGTIPFFVHDFCVVPNPALGRDVLYAGALTLGLVLFDVSRPAEPAFLGQFMDYGPTIDGHSMAVSADGTRIYLTNEIPLPVWGELNVLELSEGSPLPAVTEILRYRSPSSYVHYARRHGRFLFTANASDGMTVFDVSQGDSLPLLAWEATHFGIGPSMCWDVLPFTNAKGTFVVANEIGEGLRFYAFRPYLAAREGKKRVGSLAALGLAAHNLTMVPATVEARVTLEGPGGSFAYAAALEVPAQGTAPFSVPDPPPGALAPGAYDLAFEVRQVEAGEPVYLHRHAEKIRYR